jgi:hypothetical protein
MQNITHAENRRYLRNAYRVLLTRARQGVVSFVPLGDTADPTRSPDFYDPTSNYLTQLAFPSALSRPPPDVRVEVLF